jgi:putative ABC transport system permease protein
MTEHDRPRRDSPDLWGPDVTRDVDDELADHLAEREAEYRRQGLSAGEARRRALERFGDLGTVHATLVGIDESRERRRRVWEQLEDLARDVRLALRSLSRSPAFTVAGVLTLALGIGATTAIFSIVDAVLLRPLPYPDPDRLVVAVGVRHGPRGNVRDIVAWPDYLEWRDAAGMFESAAAIQTRGFVIESPAGPELMLGGRVTASFFGTLGVTPVLGRDFTSTDDRAGDEPVAIIGHSLWMRRFGGATDVLGRTLRVVEDGGDVDRRIVGVLPASFESPFHLPGTAEVWMPMAIRPDDMTTRDGRWLTFVGRLNPNTTIDEARSHVEALSKAGYADRSDEMLRAGYTLIPLGEYVVGEVRPALLLLLGAVGVLLLVACGNVSSLVFARALGQRRDLAVRAAIGAGRMRLLRQLLIENLVLSGVAGVLGLLMVAWSRGALVHLAPRDIPRLADTSLDWRVLLFVAATSITTAVTFGTVPALRASRLDLVGTLKPGGAGGPAEGGRIRRALMTAQVGLTFVLLTGAALLVVSFETLVHVSPGFEPAGALAADVSVAGPTDPDGDWHRTALGEIVARAAALPGVTGAALVDCLPLAPCFSNTDRVVSEFVDGPHRAPDEAKIVIEVRKVSPDYFRVMRIPLQRGRAFEGSDASNAVTVVSERLARYLWGDTDPIGRRLRLGSGAQPWVPVVGVVSDVHHFGLDREPGFMVYRRMPQQAAGTLVVRTAGDPAPLAPTLREAIHSIEPLALVRNVQTLDDVRSATVARPRFYAFLVGSFAAMATLLAAVGLFGLVAHLVAQRRQELGVRVALGARPGQLLLGVIREGVRPVAVGLALGLVAALSGTRFLRSLLFDLSPTDPRVLGAAALFLLAIALVACYLPARRVLRVDPLVALRSE